MWTLKRRDAADGVGVATADLTSEFSGSDEQLAAEIERLSELNRRRSSHDRERRLLHLRNLAGIRLIEAPPQRPAHPEPDFAALPESGELLEITPAQLTPELLRAGILRQGCVLVRGLIPRASASRFAKQIERSFEQRERHDSGQRFNDGYFSGFTPDPRYGEEVSPNWIKSGGGLLAVDSPVLSFEMLELFADAGVSSLAHAYLGERPLIAATKTTLRKADPSVAGAWHQDGKFMGEVNALNVWLSLSRCGDEAPGLDIVPRRIDHHVATQTDEAWLDHMVSQRMAEEAAGDTPIVRPIFEPGDALLFDELFLHKTASEAGMPKPRFAIENWFFGPSAFPVAYAPLAV
jgi:Phytanoyl-CoA dioxygenase (PhyH)